MSRDRRHLIVAAKDTLLRRSIASVVRNRDWELLAEIAKIVKAEVPLELAATDPAAFAAMRAAITDFHLAGWSMMTPERVNAVARQVIADASDNAVEDQASLEVHGTGF